MTVSWPGRVVHIRMQSNSVAVFFEQVPWPMQLEDVDAVLDAFNQNDWRYFHVQWRHAHQHLVDYSPVLGQIAVLLEPDTYYRPSELVELGIARGLLPHQDKQLISNEYQRLCLMPHLHQWQIGSQQADVHVPEQGWPGHFWTSAIQNVGHSFAVESAEGTGLAPVLLG